MYVNVYFQFSSDSEEGYPEFPEVNESRQDSKVNIENKNISMLNNAF